VPGKTLVWVIYAGAVYPTVRMTPSHRELEATWPFPMSELPWSCSPTRTPWIPPPPFHSSRIMVTTLRNGIASRIAAVIQRNSFAVDNGFMLDMNASLWISEAPRHARVEDSAGIHRAQCPH
jgi:hypothetical protein